MNFHPVCNPSDITGGHSDVYPVRDQHFRQVTENFCSISQIVNSWQSFEQNNPVLQVFLKLNSGFKRFFFVHAVQTLMSHTIQNKVHTLNVTLFLFALVATLLHTI